ncbi:MAG TPA: DUF1186 domain-containing protein [Verrucomicrobiae bacterium]|nr:DUF1186 domain-containing protein [Verrucomicrobiae bacterium]
MSTPCSNIIARSRSVIAAASWCRLSRLDEVLAVINYGWESAEFYTQWMHGDAKAGSEIVNASLDPLHPQSGYADYLLELFRDNVDTDPDYVARLARHYELFKSTQRPGTPSSTDAQPSTTEILAQPPMSVPEILKQFETIPDQSQFAPYEAALRAAIVQQEAITPELIAAIDRVSADSVPYLEHPERSLHIFAIYLLAQFRETSALECFIRFFSLPDEEALDLTGDLVTEHGAAVFASVSGGNPAPLLRLAHDETVNEFVRGQAIDGLLVQHTWGERPREAVIADLRGLFSSLPKPGNGYLWAALVGAVNTFNALELLPEVRQAFAEGLVDEAIIGLGDIGPSERRQPRSYAKPSPEERLRWFEERNAPIDAIDACSAWICFEDENEDSEPPDEENIDWEAPYDVPSAPPVYEPTPYTPLQPYIAPPKIGRNAPCPCGSGKKYKKCCGK